MFLPMRTNGLAHSLCAALLPVAVAAAEIRVVGSDLLGEGFARAVAEFARQNDTAVKLDLRGTRPGLVDLEAGRADLGIFLLGAAEAPPSGDLVSRVMGYPLRLALHVAFPRAAAPQLQRFLKFLLADETAAALAPAHFVPLPRGARNQLVFELEEMR